MANCSKPACGGRGRWILAYDYAEGICVLEERPGGELSPHVYLLCERCAQRLQPPVGWTLLDRRETHEPASGNLVEVDAATSAYDHDQPLLFGESA